MCSSSISSARRSDVLGRSVGGTRRPFAQGADHHVDRLGVAHPRAPALAQVRVGGAAHALGTAADRRVGVTQHDVLRRADDRLHAAAAQPVDRQCGAGVRQATVDGSDARHVHVLRFGVDDVAENALPDLLRVDLRPRHRFAHDARAELGRRDVLEGSAVIADCGPHAAQDDDFPSVGHGCLLAKDRLSYARDCAALATCPFCVRLCARQSTGPRIVETGAAEAGSAAARRGSWRRKPDGAITACASSRRTSSTPTPRRRRG